VLDGLSQREWAEAKKELQEERSNARDFTSDRNQTLNNAVMQVEEMGKELANALKAVSVAESRASVAEVLFQVYFTFLNNLDHEYMNQFHTASRWCASPASFSVYSVRLLGCIP